MTLTEAKYILGAKGLTISKLDEEYRVNYSGGRKATAYYTNDLQDAVATGLDMAKRRSDDVVQEIRLTVETPEGAKQLYNALLLISGDLVRHVDGCVVAIDTRGLCVVQTLERIAAAVRVTLPQSIAG